MRVRTRSKEMLVDHDVWFGDSRGTSGSVDCKYSNHNPLTYLPKYLALKKADDGSMTEVKSITDTVTPDYFRRSRRGEILPTNACTRSTKVTIKGQLFSRGQSAVYQLCEGKSNLQRFDALVNSVWFLPRGPRALFSSNEIDAARAEAAAKVRSMGMDALTTLVEGRQTIAMLVGAKKTLVKTIRDLIRSLIRSGRKPKTLGDLIDAASSPWLEARFGWRILYYDLLSIQDFLDKKDNEISLIVGRSKISKKVTEEANGHTFFYEESVNFGFPGFLDYSIVGNSSIANTVWDVIPFSLVVDMFFDVQERIIAYSGSPINVKLLEEANFQTTKRSSLSVAQAPLNQAGPNSYQLVLHEPTALSAYQDTYVRVHDRGIPSKWPSTKLSLGGYKPVDLFFLSKIIIDQIK